MTKLRRIEARWRRIAAVHEAGHYAVACHLDLNVHSWRIWRESAGGWSGSVGYYKLPRPPSLRKRLRIAVAGAVAEAAWFGDTIDLEAVSSADWEYARLTSYRSCDAETKVLVVDALTDTRRLLRRDGPLWPILVHMAADLITEAGDS